MSRVVSKLKRPLASRQGTEVLHHLPMLHLQGQVTSFHALPHVSSSFTFAILAGLRILALTRLVRLQTHLLQAVSGTIQFEIQVWVDLKCEVERVLGTR
jgi:hypothetical protein